MNENYINYTRQRDAPVSYYFIGNHGGWQPESIWHISTLDKTEQNSKICRVHLNLYQISFDTKCVEQSKHLFPCLVGNAVNGSESLIESCNVWCISCAPQASLRMVIISKMMAKVLLTRAACNDENHKTEHSIAQFRTQQPRLPSKRRGYPIFYVWRIIVFFPRLLMPNNHTKMRVCVKYFWAACGSFCWDCPGSGGGGGSGFHS